MFHSITSIRLPIEHPVLVFSIALIVILFAPSLFKKIRIPGIVGLILAGLAIGPHGFNILAKDSSVVLFGTIGIIYIMFFSGLEVDFNDFKKAGKKSLVFGFLTFLIPQGLGTVVSYYVLHFSMQSSVLLASMYASHTLLAYPVASKLGIKKNEAVLITVGGTLITNTVALSILAVIAGAERGHLNALFWMQILFSYAVFSVLMFLLVPRLARWFFRKIETEGTSQYIFVLALVFISASLAYLLGIEPVIGAFLAGLALNRFIYDGSTLLNRIEFVGNALFIPFFLIYVGMIIDLKTLFRGTEALFIAAVMTANATFAKWAAAFVTQKIFRYSRFQRGVIFGLSNAQAANTLAAVLIGYDLGILNENVLNGTIVMILITCIISAVSVDRSGRALALSEEEKARTQETPIREKILVPISNPKTIQDLVDFAILMKDPDSQEPIYPLSIINDTDDAQQNIGISRKYLKEAMDRASSAGMVTQLISRIDVSVAGGMIRVIKELNISHAVLGWTAKVSPSSYIFGSTMDKLLHETSAMIFVYKVEKPLNTMKKILVLLPEYAESEEGFPLCMATVGRIGTRLKIGPLFFGTEKTLSATKLLMQSGNSPVHASYYLADPWETAFALYQEHITENDLLVVVSARKGDISWNEALEKIPKRLARTFERTNLVIVYPVHYSIQKEGEFVPVVDE